jgi:hypothetical protein
MLKPRQISLVSNVLKFKFTFLFQMVNVTFNLIYRGCYILKIKKEYDLKVQAFCSPPVFLDTKFTKENIFKNTSLIISSVHNCKQ